MKKKHFVEAQPKRYIVPPDVRTLEGYGTLIAEASRNYYNNRLVHLIGTGKRKVRVKGRKR